MSSEIQEFIGFGDIKNNFLIFLDIISRLRKIITAFTTTQQLNKTI